MLDLEDGLLVGISVGFNVGSDDGLVDGFLVGSIVGLIEGCIVAGFNVSVCDGFDVGDAVKSNPFNTALYQ